MNDGLITRRFLAEVAPLHIEKPFKGKRLPDMLLLLNALYQYAVLLLAVFCQGIAPCYLAGAPRTTHCHFLCKSGQR